jgi:hypothetical protein
MSLAVLEQVSGHVNRILISELIGDPEAGKFLHSYEP